MDKLNQAMAALKTEDKRLEQELKQVRGAIAALQGTSNKGHGYTVTGSKRPRTMSTSARRRIVAAQKARWAKWRAARKKAA